MATIVHRSLAVLSACGLAASIFFYIESLSGAAFDDTPLVFAFSIGAIAAHLPMYVRERSSLKDRTFYWTGFGRGKPRWVVPLVKVFWLVALAHGVWFFVVSHHAVPIIRDGQWILSSRGRIVKVLTEGEYLKLKAEELKGFAALMIACYLTPTMYWCFPRNHQQLDCMP